MIFIDVRLFPDIPPSATAQVVHSAGRRFIVSPVPEARLKEQMLPTAPSPTPAPPVETGQDFVCVCVCACLPACVCVCVGVGVCVCFKGQLAIPLLSFQRTGFCLQPVHQCSIGLPDKKSVLYS